MQLHADFEFLLSVPHAVCIIRPLICADFEEKAFPTMLFSQHFLVCVHNIVQQMNTALIRLFQKLKGELYQWYLDDNEGKRLTITKIQNNVIKLEIFKKASAIGLKLIPKFGGI